MWVWKRVSQIKTLFKKVWGISRLLHKILDNHFVLSRHNWVQIILDQANDSTRFPRHTINNDLYLHVIPAWFLENRKGDSKQRTSSSNWSNWLLVSSFRFSNCFISFFAFSSSLSKSYMHERRKCYPNDRPSWFNLVDNNLYNNMIGHYTYTIDKRIHYISQEYKIGGKNRSWDLTLNSIR